MKLPAPSMTGQDTVIDFAAVRAKASGELRELLVKTNAGLAAGMTPHEIRLFEANRERKIIASAICRLCGYSTVTETVEFVESLLTAMAGGR